MSDEVQGKRQARQQQAHAARQPKPVDVDSVAPTAAAWSASAPHNRAQPKQQASSANTSANATASTDSAPAAAATAAAATTTTTTTTAAAAAAAAAAPAEAAPAAAAGGAAAAAASSSSDAGRRERTGGERKPRGPREPREPREPRGGEEGAGGERRERKPREPREPREPRAEGEKKERERLTPEEVLKRYPTQREDVNGVAIELPVLPERPPQLDRPNNEAHQAVIDKLNEEINKYRKRIDEITASLDKRSESNEQNKGKRAELDKQFTQTRDAYKAKKGERDELQARVEAAEKKAQALRDERKQRNTQAEFKSLEAVDAAIKRIEDTIAQESMTLPEEKRLLQKKQQLQVARTEVKGLAEFQSKVEEAEEAVRVLRKQRDAFRDDLTALREAHQKAFEARDAFLKASGERKVDPAVLQERKDLHAKIGAVLQKIKAAREEHDAKWTAFKELKTKVDDYLRIKYARDALIRREEYRQRAEAHRRAEEEVDPHAPLVSTCDSLIAYLERVRSAALKSAEQQQQQQQKATAQAAASSAPAHKANETPYVKDHNDGALVIEGLGSKKPRERRQQQAPASSSSASGVKLGRATGGDPLTSSITHSVVTFSQFAQVKVDPPLQVAEITAVLQSLRLKREEEQSASVTFNAQLEVKRAARATAAAAGIVEEPAATEESSAAAAPAEVPVDA